MAPGVAAFFDAVPAPAQQTLITVRELIYQVADAHEEVGALTETLKWGQPAYRDLEKRAGTTIRLNWSAKAPGRCELLVHCQTTLVGSWREHYAGVLAFAGNRAIHLPAKGPLPVEPLGHCIAMALLYFRPSALGAPPAGPGR